MSRLETRLRHSSWSPLFCWSGLIQRPHLDFPVTPPHLPGVPEHRPPSEGLGHGGGPGPGEVPSEEEEWGTLHPDCQPGRSCGFRGLYQRERDSGPVYWCFSSGLFGLSFLCDKTCQWAEGTVRFVTACLGVQSRLSVLEPMPCLPWAEFQSPEPCQV